MNLLNVKNIKRPEKLKSENLLNINQFSEEGNC